MKDCCFCIPMSEGAHCLGLISIFTFFRDLYMGFNFEHTIFTLFPFVVYLAMLLSSELLRCEKETEKTIKESLVDNSYFDRIHRKIRCRNYSRLAFFVTYTSCTIFCVVSHRFCGIEQGGMRPSLAA